jgi:hypothetical protein
MKYFTTFLISFNTLLCSAQVNVTISSNSVKNIAYYLDDVRISINQLFFDPGKIESIRVMKETDTINNIQGEIFIKSKNPNSFNFLSITDIARSYTNSSPTATLFMINNQVLKDDIASYMIDSSYILTVKVLKSTEISNLKKDYPSFTILMIDLKTDENIAKANRNANQINLRGSTISANN